MDKVAELAQVVPETGSCCYYWGRPLKWLLPRLLKVEREIQVVFLMVMVKVVLEISTLFLSKMSNLLVIFYYNIFIILCINSDLVFCNKLTIIILSQDNLLKYTISEVS